MTEAVRKRVFRIAVRRYAPFERAIRAQWEDFERHERTGLRLDLVAMDLHPLEASLFEHDGMRRGEWDAAFVATDWIAAMHRRGCALDLRPLLERDPPPDYPQGWSSSLLRLQKIDGTVLGVPYHDGPECLVYRKDLFEDARIRSSFHKRFGHPLAPPTSWPEFQRIARFLQEPAQRLYGTAFAAYPDGHNTVYDFLLQLWTRGGELIATDGSIRFQSEQAELALDFYRQIINDRTCIHPDCPSMDSVAAGTSFARGEVALMVNWFGFASNAHTAEDSAVRGMVDVASLPSGDGGSSVSLNVYWILSLPSGTVHPDVAWRFLRHTQTPAVDKLTTMSGAIGCRLSTWNDTEVQAILPFYQRMHSLHACAREIPQREDWPEIAATIDNLVTRALTSDETTAKLLAEADARHA